MDNQDVLVIPRQFLSRFAWFVPWEEIRAPIEQNLIPYSWIRRTDAEKSSEWVQPIPCALIRDDFHRYCAFRRAKGTREDLKSKISLIIGGHVDRTDVPYSLAGLLVQTLIREIQEEIAVGIEGIPTPVGLIIDRSSQTASRHAAFLFDVLVAGDVRSSAPEEFSIKSKINNTFFTVGELSKFRRQFDPWSRLFYEDRISPITEQHLWSSSRSIV